MITARLRSHDRSLVRREAAELERILLDLRHVNDNLAYSEVGSLPAQDERLLDALELLDTDVRAFVGLTAFWRNLAENRKVTQRVEASFSVDGDPLVEPRLMQIAEAIAGPEMTAAESAQRLRESLAMLERPLRMRARKRQGPLTTHDIRMAYAGLSVAATEAYEQFLESLLAGEPATGDREAKRKTARRLLSTLTVGVTVLGALSNRLEGAQLAEHVSIIWPDVAPEPAPAPTTPASAASTPASAPTAPGTTGAPGTTAARPPEPYDTTPAAGIRVPGPSSHDDGAASNASHMVR